jgi:hypothetical protein
MPTSLDYKVKGKKIISGWYVIKMGDFAMGGFCSPPKTPVEIEPLL